MWAHLQRQGIPVAKSTVERLMRRDVDSRFKVTLWFTTPSSHREVGRSPATYQIQDDEARDRRPSRCGDFRTLRRWRWSAAHVDEETRPWGTAEPFSPLLSSGLYLRWCMPMGLVCPSFGGRCVISVP
jgi:hypothetical protein